MIYIYICILIQDIYDETKQDHMIYYKNLYYKLEYKISLQYTADRKICQLQMCQIENNPHGNSENYIFWLCNKYSKYILAFDYRLMRK